MASSRSPAPVQRPSDHGDGIVARVVSSRAGEFSRATCCRKQRSKCKLEKIEVKKGDTIDFLVDLRGNLDSDSFVWHPVIHGSVRVGCEGAIRRPAAAAAPKDLTPWEQYAQVLLETNEFVFVD